MKILKLKARVDRLERACAKQQRVENALRQNLGVLDTLLTTIGHPVFSMVIDFPADSKL